MNEKEVRSGKNGKKVAILGFGIEGVDLTNYLLKNQFVVDVYDKNKIPKSTQDKYLKYQKEGVLKFISGKNYLKKDLLGYDRIYRSPGVYRYLPEIVKAEKKNNIKVSSATKLFFEKAKGTIIGVTGTKGKGTTATLIYKIIKKEYKDNVYLGGNIGKPVLDILDKLNDKSIVVLELSSFQLIDLDKSPNISVVLNITSDHLDWHKNEKEYKESKNNIIRFQKNDDLAVLNMDYENIVKLSRLTKARVFGFSRKKKVKGSYIKNDQIFINIKSSPIKVGSIKKVKLPGAHNQENILASITASYLAGAGIGSIKEVIYAFGGLEHRLEKVRNVNQIEFINDSFSTNIDTTKAAINSFKNDITLILGGYDKKLDYLKLVKFIVKNRRVNVIVLIGEISEKLEKLLTNQKFEGKIIKLGYAKMDKIVQKSYQLTKKHSVVLLSPAAASFDMFENYKKRGEMFKKEVNNL